MNHQDPIVFATANPNKIKEMKALLPENLQVLSLLDIGCHEDIPETSGTIEGNAMEKVRYIQKNYEYPSFADDTGLEVNSLNGAPGVYSARFAGPQKNSSANNKKLLQALSGIRDRRAQFKTVVALFLDGKIHTFTGICRGTILFQPRGEEGFGYDPLFQPEGFDRSFAEMTLEEKASISHRGRAVSQLLEFLQKY